MTKNEVLENLRGRQAALYEIGTTDLNCEAKLRELTRCIELVEKIEIYEAKKEAGK